MQSGWQPFIQAMFLAIASLLFPVAVCIAGRSLSSPSKKGDLKQEISSKIKPRLQMNTRFYSGGLLISFFIAGIYYLSLGGLLFNPAMAGEFIGAKAVFLALLFVFFGIIFLFVFRKGYLSWNVDVQERGPND